MLCLFVHQAEDLCAPLALHQNSLSSVQQLHHGRVPQPACPVLLQGPRHVWDAVRVSRWHVLIECTLSQKSASAALETGISPETCRASCGIQGGISTHARTA